MTNPIPRVARVLAIAVSAALVLFVAEPALGAPDKQVKDIALPNNVTLRYAITFPDGFDAQRSYPVILALPPGAQNFQMMSLAAANFDEALKTKPWVVVTPEAPDNVVFFRGSEKHIPALMDEVQKQVIVEGNKFHLVGYSNGGIAAFRIAINSPQRVASILTLPGYPVPEDFKKLAAIKGIPVRLYVGADDSLPWHDSNKSCEAELKKLGGDCQLTIVPAQGHAIRTMDGHAVIKALEPFRKKEGTVTPDTAEVTKVLDAFHAAAAKADEKTYFDLFAPEGVFIGTDATERWTVAQFREYAKPIFAKGRGWVYKPRLQSRHVDFVIVHGSGDAPAAPSPAPTASPTPAPPANTPGSTPPSSTPASKPSAPSGPSAPAAPTSPPTPSAPPSPSAPSAPGSPASPSKPSMPPAPTPAPAPAPGATPSSDAAFAWFDELLDSEKYGLCRGTGVMRKIGGEWKITQYHLTVPVPNELMEQVTRMIKAKTPRKP